MKATTLRAGLVTVLLVLGGACFTEAQQRWVVVNGALMNPYQLALLDRHACAAVPDGNYWLDVSTGRWGYARNPRTMGYIGAACGGGGGGGRPSLSERGMLYSSTPWGRGR
jgi:hypothetical protein